MGHLRELCGIGGPAASQKTYYYMLCTEQLLWYMQCRGSPVLGVSAIRATCQLGTQCSGEAKVSIERNGPNGSFAGERTASDSPDNKTSVVAFAFQGTCWATGSIYLTGGGEPRSRNLRVASKSVG